MNQKHLLFAIMQGLMFGWISFNALNPGAVSVTLRPDSEGSHQKVTEIGMHEFEVKVQVYEDESVEAEFAHVPRFTDYLFPAVIGVLFAISGYQNLEREERRKNAGDFDEPAIEYPSNPGPLYERFLEEDEGRRLVSRAVLEKDSEAWKAKGGDRD